MSDFRAPLLPEELSQALGDMCASYLDADKVDSLHPLLPRRVYLELLKVPCVLIPFAPGRCSILLLDVNKQVFARFLFDHGTVLPAPGQATKPVLMIVEDDPEILNFVEIQFSSQFAVHTFTGPPPLALVDALWPDAILLDLQLPEVTGEAFLEQIRVQSRWHVPVIIVSGQPTRQQMLDAGGLFYNCFLRKPIPLNAVETALLRCLALLS